jgi:hypothetical protein
MKNMRKAKQTISLKYFESTEIPFPRSNHVLIVAAVYDRRFSSLCKIAVVGDWKAGGHRPPLQGGVYRRNLKIG